MMSFDWKVSENGWKNNGYDKCVSFEPDCGTDEVEEVQRFFNLNRIKTRFLARLLRKIRHKSTQGSHGQCVPVVRQGLTPAG